MIKKNNLLRQIAETFGGFDPDLYDHQNICKYVRCILFGIFSMTILIIVISALLWVCFVSPIMWIVVCFIYDAEIWVKPPDAAGTGMILWIVATFLTAGIFSLNGIKWCFKKAFNKAIKPKPDGIVKTYYKSVKEKTCIFLEFE